MTLLEPLREESATPEGVSGLEERLQAFLHTEGYTPERELGKGQTSTVWDARYTQGALVTNRVLKILRKDVDPTSVTTLINEAKGLGPSNEVRALCRLSHPNIIQIHDVLEHEGDTIISEEHYDGISLEELLAVGGPLSEPQRVRDIFTQASKGLEHVHRQGLLHRDIKPSNLLVGKQDGHVKLIDFQNAAKRGDIEQGSLTTHGAIAYTHADLLRGLLTNDEEAAASLESEFYAFGTTLYKALTGKVPLDRALVPAENGTTIQIGDATLDIALTEDGVALDNLDHKTEQEKLRKAIHDSTVPRQYRKVLERCLLDTPKAYHNSYTQGHEFFRQDLEKATSLKKRVLGPLVKHVRLATIAAAVASGLAFGITTGANVSGRITEPTVYELLSSPDFLDGNVVWFGKETNTAALKELADSFTEIRAKLPEVEKQHRDTLWGFNTTIQVLGMNGRLSYALIRSTLMADQDAMEEIYGGKRLDISLAPREFAYKRRTAGPFRNMSGFRAEHLDDFAKAGDGVAWLRQCIGTNTTVVDVFADYFCSRQEVAAAQTKANTTSYFATGSGAERTLGYRSFLPDAKRTLIDRATAMHAITTNNGDVHLDALDANNRPIKGLEAK